MKMNKRAQVEISDLFSIIFILIILILYFVFIVFGDVFTSGDIESVISSKENIEVLSYFPSFQSYLGTEVSYNNEERSIYSLIREYSEDTSNSDLKDFLEAKTEEIFSEMEYCYYYDFSDSDLIYKRSFMVFVKNPDESNLGIKEGIYNTPAGSLEGKYFIGQKLTEDLDVYLGFDLEIVRGDDCDVIH